MDKKITSHTDVLFESEVNLKNIRFNIKFIYIYLDGDSKLRFLEDCFPSNSSHKRRLVCVLDNRLIISDDEGETWVRIYEDVKFKGKIDKSFTLANGGRIVQTIKPMMTYVFDSDNNLVFKSEQGICPWHGSQGIGESRSGAVMYAEYYPTRKELVELNVWKLDRKNKKWNSKMSVTASGSPPNGEIRHFHLCQPDPVLDGHWVLASGDIGSHNRIWFSQDDGENWTEAHVSEQPDKVLQPSEWTRVLRFTSIVGNRDMGYIWATDDSLGLNKAAIVKASYANNNLDAKIVSWLDENYARNIIPVHENVLMVLTEAKNNISNVYIYFYNKNTDECVPLVLKNQSGMPSSFTASLASKHVRNGNVYIPGNGGVLTSKTGGIVRINIRQTM